MTTRSGSAIGILGRLEAPWAVALFALVAYTAFAGARLHHFDFDPSGFVVAGDAFIDAKIAPRGLRVLEGSHGYDGLFFYRLALHPFTAEQTDFGITLDAPAYRQQRILYPLITWALTRGDPGLVPATLVAVNILGLGAITWLAALWCQRAGCRPLWGLVIAGHPGFVFSLARDLSEITAAVFVLGGLLAWQASRYAAAGIVLSLAALARETTLLVPLGLALGTWIDSRSKRGAWLILPAAVLAVWELQLVLSWGELPFQQATALTPPFTGLARFVSEYIPPERSVELWYLAGATYLAGLIALTAYSIRRAAECPALVVAWTLYVALATALSWNVWIEDISFLRVTTELQILSVALLIHLQSPSWVLRLVGTATGVLWLHHALVRIDHL